MPTMMRRVQCARPFFGSVVDRGRGRAGRAAAWVGCAGSIEDGCGGGVAGCRKIRSMISSLCLRFFVTRRGSRSKLQTLYRIRRGAGLNGAAENFRIAASPERVRAHAAPRRKADNSAGGF